MIGMVQQARDSLTRRSFADHGFCGRQASLLPVTQPKENGLRGRYKHIRFASAGIIAASFC